MIALRRQQQNPPRTASSTVFSRALPSIHFPELSDHSLIQQAAEWPVLSNREPVRTDDHAGQSPDGARIVALPWTGGRRARPFRRRWLVVSPPVNAKITVPSPDGTDRVPASSSETCAEERAAFADRYHPAPSALEAPLVDGPHPPNSTGALRRTLALSRPRLPGHRRTGSIGNDGMEQDSGNGPRAGALLDNAGQLSGYWVMARHDRSCGDAGAAGAVSAPSHRIRRRANASPARSACDQMVAERRRQLDAREGRTHVSSNGRWQPSTSKPTRASGRCCNGRKRTCFHVCKKSSSSKTTTARERRGNGSCGGSWVRSSAPSTTARRRAASARGWRARIAAKDADHDLL